MKSDFEKFVIARHYIQALKIDIGKLKTEMGVLESERDEFKYHLENQNKLSEEEKKRIKTEQWYQILKALNHKKDKIIRDLRKDKEFLIIKLNSK